MKIVKQTNNLYVLRLRGPTKQRGAALFTALMMLIILAILGVAAARVTALQERMVGVYLADVEAFQSAEDLVRDNERTILANDVDSLCFSSTKLTGDIPTTWANGSETESDVYFENIGRNPTLSLIDSAQAGKAVEIGGPGCLFFRVNSLGFDATGETSRAVVQTLYIP
ncbi:MAG: pilus assembly PilX family protein [Pseudomarimonas sp.]